MKYKTFPLPIFNHFINSSLLPIAKLKSLHGFSRVQLLPNPTLLLVLSGKHDHQAFHYPSVNFASLLRGSVFNSMLIIPFDAYLTPRLSSLSPKTQLSTQWDLNQDPSDSESSALSHLSMTLAHKYVNLKELYNQDIKELVTTKNVLKKEHRFYMKSQTPQTQ